MGGGISSFDSNPFVKITRRHTTNSVSVTTTTTTTNTKKMRRFDSKEFMTFRFQTDIHTTTQSNAVSRRIGNNSLVSQIRSFDYDNYLKESDGRPRASSTNTVHTSRRQIIKVTIKPKSGETMIESTEEYDKKLNQLN